MVVATDDSVSKAEGQREGHSKVKCLSELLQHVEASTSTPGRCSVI